MPDPIFRSDPDWYGACLTVDHVTSQRAAESGAVVFVDAESLGCWLDAQGLDGLIRALIAHRAERLGVVPQSPAESEAASLRRALLDARHAP